MDYLKDTKLHIHYRIFTVGTHRVVLYFSVLYFSAISDRSFLFPHIGPPPILDLSMLLFSLSNVEMTSQVQMLIGYTAPQTVRGTVLFHQKCGCIFFLKFLLKIAPA